MNAPRKQRGPPSRVSRRFPAADSVAQTRLRLRLNHRVRWIWELLDPEKHVMNVSSQDFVSRRECELDARRHGLKPQKPAPNVSKIRRKVGLNQTEFWERVGVTQSGGSRYEQGRAIRKPLRMLLTLAYGAPKEREAVVKRLATARGESDEEKR